MEISIALSSRHVGDAKLYESWSCACKGKAAFFPPNNVLIKIRTSLDIGSFKTYVEL